MLKTKMNPEVKQKWIDALRSDKYEQGSGKLRSVTGYCCLGVLCDLYSQEHNTQWEFRGDEEINTQSQEVRNALGSAAKRAQKISEHPDSTKRYTIEHLFYQALIAQSLSQYQKEIDLWERIINLDPQNIYALRSRLKALLKRNELTASLREFNKLIRQNFDTPKDWEAVLGFLVNNNFHQEFFHVWTNISVATVDS